MGIERLPPISPTALSSLEEFTRSKAALRLQDSMHASDSPTHYSPSMPELSLPYGNRPAPSMNAAILDIIASMDEIHQTSARVQQVRNLQIGRDQKRISALQQKEVEALKEEALKTQESGVWSYLQKIGSYVLSAINFVLGGILFSTGSALIGGAMIFAGIFSAITATVTPEFWSWLSKQLAEDNEELAKQLSEIFPTAIGLVGAALNFLGTFEAWTIYEQLDWTAHSILVAKTALGLAEGVTTIGKGISDHGVAKSRVHQTQFQAQITHHDHALKTLTKHMESWMKTLTQRTSLTADTLQLYVHSYPKPLQG